MSGKQLMNFNINPIEFGEIRIHGGALKAGMYTYTLIADSKVIGTKQLILTSQ
jgi:hypothetical protein